MKKKLVYNKVKEILTHHKETRDSDKKLIWLFWVQTGKATYGKYTGNVWQDGVISQSDFNSSVIPETIRRSRQKLQQEFKHLQPTSEKVRRTRRFKSLQKGTHIYRETY